MPRVSSYTPAWLSRPSPGFDFFNKPQASPSKTITGSNTAASLPGPYRTLARRGTQVFTIVGNELRWSDLRLLRGQWESQRQRQRGVASSFGKSVGPTDTDGDHEPPAPTYRVLKAPVSRQIQQLVVSPTGDYMAIVTSHTVHVAVLPDPSHLMASDMTDLKLKTFQLGPTSHVVERSPVASVIWHPLGVQGTALVTVTADSIVRLWELDISNRWSFDSPALAFDLKKLADGRSTAEDFSPSKYGMAKAFSPDSFEMDVASVCFGGSGQYGEAPWAAMTLWVAMKEGDVYALCPLLPAKSDPPEPLIKALSSSVRCKAASLAKTNNAPFGQRKLADQQLAWLADIENQPTGAIVQRPSQLGSIPKLQGPFRFAPDSDLMFDITDIYTFSPTLDGPPTDNDTFAPADDDDSLVSSLELICLATKDGSIHLCANLDSIEARWLPMKKSSRLLEDEKNSVDPELLIVETISLSNSRDKSWPLITQDAQTQNLIYITHSSGITSVDLSSFTTTLLGELNGSAESGIEFRLGMLLENSSSSVEQPITFTSRLRESLAQSPQPPACISLTDGDLGHLLVTVVGGSPQAVTLDDNGNDFNFDADAASDTEEIELQGILNSESRPSYQPPEEFWADSTLPGFMSRNVHGRSRRFMAEEIRLSQTTLNLLMEAHRVLSNETHRLGVAASDLFNRCERLQDEFQEQITLARDGADRVDAVLGEDADYYEGNDDNLFGGTTTAEVVMERLATAKERQESLAARYDGLRSKLSTLNGRALSEKEKTWIAEISSMGELLNPTQSQGDKDPSENSSFNKSTDRYESVKKLKTSLLEDAKEATDKADAAAAAAAATTAGPEADDAEPNQDAWDVLSIKPDKRRARLAEINAMLERQTALVEATRTKLERLDHTPI